MHVLDTSIDLTGDNELLMLSLELARRAQSIETSLLSLFLGQRTAYV